MLNLVPLVALGLTVGANQGIRRSDWTAAFESQPTEFSSVALPLKKGTPPADLHGTLFKNGPANFARGSVPYAHWLDGDGYVTALHIEPNAPATWSGRYVHTEAFEEEAAADAVLFRTTFGTNRPGGLLANALDFRLKSPANTNVLPFGDAILALWEAGPPYALDPHTLACRGRSTLGGRLQLSAAGAELPSRAAAGHGALPGTTGLPLLDATLERAGWLTDACSAHPRVDPHWGLQGHQGPSGAITAECGATIACVACPSTASRGLEPQRARPTPPCRRTPISTLSRLSQTHLCRRTPDALEAEGRRPTLCPSLPTLCRRPTLSRVLCLEADGRVLRLCLSAPLHILRTSFAHPSHILRARSTLSSSPSKLHPS